MDNIYYTACRKRRERLWARECISERIFVLCFALASCPHYGNCLSKKAGSLYLMCLSITRPQGTVMRSECARSWMKGVFKNKYEFYSAEDDLVSAECGGIMVLYGYRDRTGRCVFFTCVTGGVLGLLASAVILCSSKKAQLIFYKGIWAMALNKFTKWRQENIPPSRYIMQLVCIGLGFVLVGPHCDRLFAAGKQHNKW